MKSGNSCILFNCCSILVLPLKRYISWGFSHTGSVVVLLFIVEVILSFLFFLPMKFVTKTLLLFPLPLQSLTTHCDPTSEKLSPTIWTGLRVGRTSPDSLSLLISSHPYSDFPLPPESGRCFRPGPTSSSCGTCTSSILSSVGHTTPPPHLPQQVTLPPLPTDSTATLGEEPHHERALAAGAAERDGRRHMLTLAVLLSPAGKQTLVGKEEEEVAAGRTHKSKERERVGEGGRGRVRETERESR